MFHDLELRVLGAAVFLELPKRLDPRVYDVKDVDIVWRDMNLMEDVCLVPCRFSGRSGLLEMQKGKDRMDVSFRLEGLKLLVLHFHRSSGMEQLVRYRVDEQEWGRGQWGVPVTCWHYLVDVDRVRDCDLPLLAAGHILLNVDFPEWRSYLMDCFLNDVYGEHWDGCPDGARWHEFCWSNVLLALYDHLFFRDWRDVAVLRSLLLHLPDDCD